MDKRGLIRVVNARPPIEGRPKGVLHGAGFIQKEDARTAFRGRRFDRFLLTYVATGTGWYVNGAGERVPIRGGQAIQMPANEALSLVHDMDGEWTEWFVALDPEWVAATVVGGAVEVTPEVLTTGRCPDVEARFDRMLSGLEADPADPTLVADALWIWTELWRAHRANAASGSSGGGEARLVEVARVLGQRLDRRGSTREILRIGSGAYEEMRRKFAKRFGVSPGRYRILRRIEAAKSALLDPRRQIKEIASTLGYGDAMTFSKQFQRETGRWPREFRREFYGAEIQARISRRPGRGGVR